MIEGDVRRRWLELTLCIAAGACAHEPLRDTDELFFDWGEQRVLCAAGLDTVSRNSMESVLGGLERAAERDEVIVLYAHKPGRTVPVEEIEEVLARAVELGLEFVTAPDLVAGGPRRAGLHLGFDDSAVDDWFSIREMMASYGARVSFYVTRYDLLNEERRGKLHALVADGHSVEAHSMRHHVAPDYVEDRGLRAYMDEEALPSIELLREDGFDPVAYAYPFGARTSELDEALLEHVQLVRSVTFTIPYPLISDPCPE